MIVTAAASSFVVDAIVAEEAQGAMPTEAPATLGSSADSFQHVEAITALGNGVRNGG